MYCHLECETGWTRFGDACLQAQDNTTLNAQEAEDFCADIESNLWWPESDLELQFVDDHIW